MDLLLIENVCDGVKAITPVTDGQKRQEILAWDDEEVIDIVNLYLKNPIACRFAYMAHMYQMENVGV